MKRVTILDVAREAGVSRQTVSRAINNLGDVSPTTKARVLTAVKELGYQPNRLARSMVTRKTHTLGLVIADITNPFFPEVARGVQDVAKAHDYNVFLSNTDDDPAVELSALKLMANQAVDGVILFSHAAREKDVLTWADQFHPVVMINREMRHNNIDCIMVDNEAGAMLAIDHLYNLGHKKIGMLGRQTARESKELRRQGYTSGMAKNNLPVNSAWFARVEPTLDGGYHGACELLKAHPDLTALFCYNDLIAVGAIRAANEMGLQVPKDFSIVGFDDIRLASMISPALTTISFDKYELGRLAATRFFTRLADPNSKIAAPHIPIKINIRASTAHAPL